MKSDYRSKLGFIAGVAVAALAFAAFTFIPRASDSQPAPQAVSEPAPQVQQAAQPAEAPAFARIALDEMKQRYDRGDIIVLDVRDLDAYAAAHIPGALQIPLSRIEGEIPYLPKGKTIVTYCTCPNEESSGQAVQILANGGITNAAALAGGLGAWQKSGYPIGTGLK